MHSSSLASATSRIARALVLVLLFALPLGNAATAQESQAAARAPQSASSAPPSASDGTATIRYYNRDIVTLRDAFLGHRPELRARAAEANIQRIAARSGMPQVSFRSTTEGDLILLGDELVVVLSPADVDTLHGQTLPQLREQTVANLAAAVTAEKVEQAPAHLAKGVLWSMLATLIAGLLIYATAWVGRKAREAFKRRILAKSQQGGDQSLATLLVLLRAFTDWALRLVFALAILFVVEEWLRFVLGRFGYTRPWADAMGNWLFATAEAWARAFASAVPGLVTALLIFVLARFVTKTMTFTFRGVQNGRFHLFGIDKELAEPTRKLAVVGVWLFALAMAYPYLPGAQTDAFKGVSVLVGVMVSLGASGIVGQAAGGFTILYSRTMSVGDFVRCGEVEGWVQQIGIFTTRIRTVTGVEVSIPNNVVLGGQLHNFSRHPDGPGMWLETNVTIGYDAPWRQVHRMLLEGAASTAKIQADPAPYVLQTALSDFYVEYKLRVRVPDAFGRAQVLTELHANIQDVFNREGVQIMSPNYEADPEQPKVVPRKYWESLPIPPEANEAVDPPRQV